MSVKRFGADVFTDAHKNLYMAFVFNQNVEGLISSSLMRLCNSNIIGLYEWVSMAEMYCYKYFLLENELKQKCRLCLLKMFLSTVKLSEFLIQCRG